MHLHPLEQASAILGEHMNNYVILPVDSENPQTAMIAYDSKYAAQGLLRHGLNVIENEIEVDSDYEIVWDEEEDEEE